MPLSPFPALAEAAAIWARLAYRTDAQAITRHLLTADAGLLFAPIMADIAREMGVSPAELRAALAEARTLTREALRPVSVT